MKRSLLSILAVCLWAQETQPDPRVAFQQIYNRIDAAVAAKDQSTIDSLIPSDTQVHIGPFNLTLRAAIGSEMAKEGLTRKSEVTSAVLEGQTAVVTVEVAYTVAAGGGNRVTLHDTWERRDDRWVCRESERTGGDSKTRPTSADEARPVIAELKTRATRLATLEPGSGFEDLEAFGKAVGEARIVALGEATHGTQEFFRLKLRLIEYLVRRKGFTVVAFEISWPDALAVDRYIKTPDAPYPGVGHRDVMEWMRAANRAGARLTSTGFDMQNVGPAADLAVRYLERVAPAAAPAAAAAYTKARKIDSDHTNIFLPYAHEAAQDSRPILAQFDAHKADWTAKSSAAEWRDARHAAYIVVVAAEMRVESNGLKYRDREMARNVEWLAEEAHPHEKIILWAHNGHVSADEGTMGGWVRQRFGAAYYVVGTAFRRGEIWSWGVDGQENKGFGAWPVAPAPEGTGDAIFSAAGMPLFFLDLTTVPKQSHLGVWLAAEHRFNIAGGVVLIGKENMSSESLIPSYDGLVFVEESHAARPAGEQR